MRQIVAVCWTAKQRVVGSEVEGRRWREKESKGWPRRVISRRNGRLERLARLAWLLRKSYCY